MDFDNEPHIREFSNEMFDKDIDNNLLTKLSSSELAPYIDNSESGAYSKFDSKTFSKNSLTGISVSGRSLDSDEFHDAASATNRETPIQSPDSPIDNMSQAIPTPDTSRLSRNTHANTILSSNQNSTPSNHVDKHSSEIQHRHNGIDNDSVVESKEQNTGKIYSEEEVREMIESSKQAERAQWQVERRKLETAVETKNNEIVLLKSGMTTPDASSLDSVISAHNMAYTDLLIQHHRPREDTLQRQVKKLSEDNTKILKEMDICHTAMSDLHKRYDKAREVINSMKQNEDLLEKKIRTYQEELEKSETNCRVISSKCDELLETANARMESIRGECEKDKVMMEASIKRLELDCKSWQSKFLDKESSERELIAICDSLMGVKEQEANGEL